MAAIMQLEFRSAGRRHLAILAVIPLMVLVLYCYNPVWRIYSDHGFFHQSIVFALMNGEKPPNSPILANHQLLYLWGHHYVVAVLARLTDVPLSWIFASINLAALTAAIIFCYIFGSRLRSQPLDGFFAAILAIVGCNLLSRGIFVDLLQRGLRSYGFSYDLWEYRELVIAKFYNLNSNGLGIAVVLGWLLASTEYCVRVRRGWAVLFLVTLSAAMVGFFYPVYMPNIAGAIALLASVSLLRSDLIDRVLAFRCVSATAIGLLVSVPYVLSVSAGRTTPAFQFADLGWFLNKGAKAALALSIVAVLIVCFRKAYLHQWRVGTARWLLPFFLMAISVAAYPPIVQQDTEYKHLLLATVMAGLLAGPALAELFKSFKPAAALLIAVLATPFLSDWLDLMNVERWPAFTPVIENGAALYSPDPEQDAFYRWVRTHTTVRDAFVDDELLMPVLGQRPLYFGTEKQTVSLKHMQSQTGREYADGWEWRPEDLALQQGYDPNLIAQRKQVSQQLLNRGRKEGDLEEFHGHHLFLVARSTTLRATLEKERLYQRAYGSKNLDLYIIR